MLLINFPHTLTLPFLGHMEGCYLVVPLIEGNWVVASHSCFPLSGNWSLVSLCLWQLWWWFAWSLVWVFTSAPPLSLSSLPLYPLFRVRVLHLDLHQLLTYVVLLLISLLSPSLGAKFMSHLSPLSCFLLSLTVCLLTLYFLFYHTMCGCSLTIKTKTPEVLTQHW